MTTDRLTPAADSGFVRRQKTTIASLQSRKRYGPKIVRVNCYDYLTARIVDEAGIDMILVGDSVGRLVLGYSSLEMVTLEEILHHAKAVRRGAEYALVVADLPLSSRDAPVGQVIRAARQLVACGVDAIKVEGGDEVIPQIEGLVAAGVSMHGTLRPDPSLKSSVEQAKKLYWEALAQERAGCFMLSLAGVPANVARFLTERLTIPTIGSGSGPHCDGQVMVIHDVLGYTLGPQRPFTKAYANFREQAEVAVRRFKSEAENGQFPGPSHSHETDYSQFEEFVSFIGD